MAKRLSLIFIGVWLFFATTSAFAFEPLLFDVTFEDETVSESLLIRNGQYEVVDDSLSYMVAGGGFVVIADGGAWVNYALETRFRLNAGRIWLQARTDADLCSGYYFIMGRDSGDYRLSVSDADCNFTVLQEAHEEALTQEWNTARLTVQGDAIRAYINDRLVFDVRDATHSRGLPVINVFPIGDEPAHVDFDYIRVTELDEMSIGAHPTIPYDVSPEQVLSALRELQVVPAGDDGVVRNDDVSIARIGAWFEPLFDNVSATNAVMAAEIEFLPYNMGEFCVLSGRIERDEGGVARGFLDVGINSAAQILIGETDDNGVYSLATQENVINDTHAHVLFVANDDLLTVYINGMLVYQDVNVTPRKGTFGISAVSTTSFSLCHVKHIWVHVFD